MVYHTCDSCHCLFNCRWIEKNCKCDDNISYCGDCEIESLERKEKLLNDYNKKMGKPVKRKYTKKDNLYWGTKDNEGMLNEGVIPNDQPVEGLEGLASLSERMNRQRNNEARLRGRETARGIIENDFVGEYTTTVEPRIAPPRPTPRQRTEPQLEIREVANPDGSITRMVTNQETHETIECPEGLSPREIIWREY